MRIDLLADVNASLKELGSSVKDTDWREGGTVQNWRRYVPAELRTRWVYLTDETRGAVYYVADQVAGRENGG